jgi:hypothetical protein
VIVLKPVRIDDGLFAVRSWPIVVSEAGQDRALTDREVVRDRRSFQIAITVCRNGQIDDRAGEGT